MSIISHCPWCGNRQKPEVLKTPDPVTGRHVVTYKCRKCGSPWRVDAEGESEKIT